jgi:hypothetical protein
LGETRGSNVTFIGRSSNISNTSSWYEGEHAFLRDRFSPGDAILPSPDGKGPYCRRSAKCEGLNFTTCMGVKLTYGSTTLELVGDSSTQEQIQVLKNTVYYLYLYIYIYIYIYRLIILQNKYRFVLQIQIPMCIKFNLAALFHFSSAHLLHFLLLSKMEPVAWNLWIYSQCFLMWKWCTQKFSSEFTTVFCNSYI